MTGGQNSFLLPTPIMGNTSGTQESCDLKFLQQGLRRGAFHFPYLPFHQGLPPPQEFSKLGAPKTTWPVSLQMWGREGEQYVENLIQWVWGGPVLYMLPKTSSRQ